MGWVEIGYGRGLGLGLGLGLAAKRRAKREETFQGKESVRCEKKKGGIERWRSENPEKVFGDIDMVSTLPRFCLCTFLLPRDRSGGDRERSTGRKKHMALAFASRCSPLRSNPSPPPLLFLRWLLLLLPLFPCSYGHSVAPEGDGWAWVSACFFVPRLPNHGR